MHKAQGAIEYLMTYGWAIVSVALAVAAMYSLGIFSSLRPVGPGSCVSISGFQCTKPVLYSSGVLIAGVGLIGQVVTITSTACTMNDTSTGATFYPVPAQTLGSGQEAQLLFRCPLPSPNSTLGTQFNGYLWIQYNVPGGGQVEQPIGEVSVPVTVSGQAAIQPDVLVQYANGILVGYNATAATNSSRGEALVNVFTTANLIAGESIYLKSETYDIGFNNLNQSYADMTGIKLYGAGKYRTTIISEYGGLGNSKSIIEMGRNSVTADLSIIANSTYVNDAWGISGNGDPGESFGNSTLRNVYIQVQANSEGVGISMGGSSYSGIGIGNIIIENVTVKTQGGSVGMYILSPPAFLYPPGYNGLVLVFDSTIDSNNGTIPEAFSCADLCNAIVVNDNFTALGGSSSSYGLETYNNGRMMVYGGKVGTAGGTALDLYNAGSSLEGDDITYLAVDSSVSYNALKTSGTINSIVGGYGPYSYQGYPMTPPGNWIG